MILCLIFFIIIVRFFNIYKHAYIHTCIYTYTKTSKHLNALRDKHVLNIILWNRNKINLPLLFSAGYPFPGQDPAVSRRQDEGAEQSVQATGVACVRAAV